MAARLLLRDGDSSGLFGSGEFISSLANREGLPVEAGVMARCSSLLPVCTFMELCNVVRTGVLRMCWLPRGEAITFATPTLGVDEYRPCTALAAAEDSGT